MKLNVVEYALEGFGLGLFMLSASVFGVALFHPGSPVVAALPDPIVRRAMMGLAMGLTNILNVYAPWGRRSGAHLNPATTLTFFALGKVPLTDVAGYITGQFIGGALGMVAASRLLRPWLADPAVNYVATVPGTWGDGAAFVAELVISAGLMLVVLTMVANPRLAKYAGCGAAVLVCLYITFEAPISGMSMNPARSLASALAAHRAPALWIYFTAPVIGMLTAAALRHRFATHHCAKLLHDPRYPCIFCPHPPPSA